jgi:ribose 5-phosphate isomerase B
MNKIVIGSDHAGFEYKEKLIKVLEDLGYTVEDFGTHSLDSVDYPDFAHPVASRVNQGETKFGVLICGSGNGVSMTANKYENVRAALCWTPEISELARLHNAANICSIPARFVDIETATQILKKFLNTDFEGGRHQRRVDKISSC